MDAQERTYEEDDFITPSNYRALNIIAVVLGFFSQVLLGIPLILGIVGLIYSFQVDTRIRNADVLGSKNASRTAKILGITSVVISSLFILIAGLFFGLLVLAHVR